MFILTIGEAGQLAFDLGKLLPRFGPVFIHLRLEPVP